MSSPRSAPQKQDYGLADVEVLPPSQELQCQDAGATAAPLLRRGRARAVAKREGGYHTMPWMLAWRLG
jgi:hypothetical protein